MSNELFSEDPLITVVIPTYNRSMLVMDAIASVWAQTFTNWELIVADDGSEDDTVEKVRAIADPRIRLLALPHCGNIATVRNAGARAGSGPWIAFLDSDDLWFPEKLRMQVNVLKEQGLRWCYGGFELMNEGKQTISNKTGSYYPFSGWIIEELLMCKASVNIGTVMLERSLFHEIGGFDPSPRLICREDYEFALRLALQAKGVAIPELLVRVREHGGRTTNGFEGCEITAYAYQHFINTRPGKQLERIAYRQKARELAEASVVSLRAGNYRRAMRQWGRALFDGDGPRHLLSCLYRGVARGRAKTHKHS